MKRFINNYYQSGFSYLLLIVSIGLLISALAFLMAFVTSPRASLPSKYKNLKLSVPIVPQEEILPVLNANSLPIASSSTDITISAELSEELLEANPIELATDEAELLLPDQGL